MPLRGLKNWLVLGTPVSCHKRSVKCTLLTEDGASIAATNNCFKSPQYCERERLSVPSGEGYDLCGSVHAEMAALAKAHDQEVDIRGGIAVIEGHYYVCPDCAFALESAGIRKIVINLRGVDV